MSEDITFCYYHKCPNRKCERHDSHIKIPYKPHSFAFYKSCKYWDMPEQYFAASDAQEGKDG